jgi:pimeloyl-ACP methyl ester carboxylesterase
VDWTPGAYSDFLNFVLTSVMARPHAIIAAGHAATYVLKHAADAAPPTPWLVLIAPTWRGPLPTMVGGHRPFFDRICTFVDRPVLGPLLYGLNVNRVMVRYMGAGHVYADPAFLEGERLRDKLAVVRARGARFASVRFVTGRLDPLDSRDAFLDAAQRAVAPILLVYSVDTPPKSRAEMEALAAVAGVRTMRLPHGKLAVHEEFPDATMDAIAPFLSEEASAR